MDRWVRLIRQHGLRWSGRGWGRGRVPPRPPPFVPTPQRTTSPTTPCRVLSGATSFRHDLNTLYLTPFISSSVTLVGVPKIWWGLVVTGTGSDPSGPTLNRALLWPLTCPSTKRWPHMHPSTTEPSKVFDFYRVGVRTVTGPVTSPVALRLMLGDGTNHWGLKRHNVSDLLRTPTNQLPSLLS